MANTGLHTPLPKDMLKPCDTKEPVKIHKAYLILVQGVVSKQLLAEVFVISKIIKVKVRVISKSRMLRLISLTSTMIILDITKNKFNNYLIIHWTKRWRSSFCFFTDEKQHKACKLEMITRDLECAWHDYRHSCSDDVMDVNLENSLYALSQSEKSYIFNVW